ncbi:hypothetical protein CF327_g7631 [Tilletia walkeri]|nr:hypothetical protein CF327_g7631 [Tilletia walkeri]
MAINKRSASKAPKKSSPKGKKQQTSAAAPAHASSPSSHGTGALSGSGSGGVHSGVSADGGFVAQAQSDSAADVAGAAAAAVTSAVVEPPTGDPATATAATTKTKKKRADAVPQWKNDAAAPGLPSSMTILLTWLQDEGNYDKWKGAEGDSQAVLAADVSQRISEAKTKVERKAFAVVEKIKDLEKKFRQANDFRLQTGQGILDAASATDAEDQEEAMKLAEKSVEDAIINYCPYYYELVEVMSDRISTNPKGSYSSTAASDPAGSLLRGNAVGSGSEDGDDDADLDGDEDKDEDDVMEVGPPKKKVIVGKGKGRPSDTGRKFGKKDASSSTPKRKPSALEAALERRSTDRTQMESELNGARVKSERASTLLALVREIREADYTIEFQDAMEQAKALYENL